MGEEKREGERVREMKSEIVVSGLDTPAAQCTLWRDIPTNTCFIANSLTRGAVYIKLSSDRVVRLWMGIFSDWTATEDWAIYGVQVVDLKLEVSCQS